MNDEFLKSLMIRDRGFLYSLYEAPNILKNKRILLNASDTQINTLLRYLHFVANGRIPIKKTNFEKIPQSKLRIIKKDLESLPKLRGILRSAILK